MERLSMLRHLRPYTLLALILFFSAISCADKQSPIIEESQLIPVRFIATICGEAICQITDKNLQGLGEQDFELNGREYDGVFRTNLPCVLPPTPSVNAEQPDKVWVRISTTPLVEDGDCVRCMATFSKSPTVFYFIEIVR